MIRHVACAMSGGVDSAVAALLLKQKGFRVTGVFMRNWDIANEKGNCSADKDCEDAKYVCNNIGIPFREVNFTREYWNDVFSELLKGYEAGVTPNPDVLCNKYIKFGRLFHYAVNQLGADALATGHYARNSAGQFLQHIDKCRNGVKLLTSVDTTKDQTLFLSQINQTALRRSMFPVGGLLKTDVKRIALEAGLDYIVKKRESVGICFIGTRCFRDFIEEYIEPSSGEFVDIETGQVMGEHKGVQYWTIGQRALLPGLSKAYFVCARDPSTQTIHVAAGTDHPALYSQLLTTAPVHWIHDPIPLINLNQHTTSHQPIKSANFAHPQSTKQSLNLAPHKSIKETLNLAPQHLLNSATEKSLNSVTQQFLNSEELLNSATKQSLNHAPQQLNSTKQSLNFATQQSIYNSREKSDSLKTITNSSNVQVDLQFRFQHTHPMIGCKVRACERNRLEVCLDRPIRALTVGQYAVFYKDGRECLGSAEIVNVGPSMWDLQNFRTKHAASM